MRAASLPIDSRRRGVFEHVVCLLNGKSAGHIINMGANIDHVKVTGLLKMQRACAEYDEEAAL